VKSKTEEKYISYNFAFLRNPPWISYEAADTGESLSFSLPHPPHAMLEVKDFVVTLARGVKFTK
jgi:hypothetical protein